MIQVSDINTLVSTTTSYASTIFVGILPTLMFWVLSVAALFFAGRWVLSVFRRH